MEEPNAIWLVIAIVAVFAIYTLIRRRKNLAALETGGKPAPGFILCRVGLASPSCSTWAFSCS